jgi:hypothetical protein
MVFSGQFALPSAAKDHTHGKAAANRTGAVSWVQNAVLRLGRRPVWVQARASDVRRQRAHSTVWYWVNDLGVEQKWTDIRRDDVIVMVDVDYYADMNNWLATFPHNIFVLYTLTPTEAGGNTDEYSYYFDSSGLLEMHISGGANFHHNLWDYSSDELRASGGWFSNTSYRLVERRYVGCDHSVIWLFPAGWVVWGCDWLLRWLGWQLDATPLVPFNPVVGQFARYIVNDTRGCLITTCRVGSFDACTVEASVDSRVRAAALATTVTLTNHTVESYGVSKDAAIFLTDYWRSKPEGLPPVMAIGPAPVTNYECGPEFVEEAKPSVHAYMDPIVSGGAFAPFVSQGNMATAVQKRLVDITSDAEPTSQLEEFMHEFVDEILKEAGIERNSLNPTDIEEVYEKQSSRAQRTQFGQYGVTRQGIEEDASAFMKKETYPEVKDPRIITNFKPNEKFEYSCFVYTITKILKRCHWYSFVEPAVLEERMKKFFGKFNLAETDFYRMDGRYSKVLRLLELIFALAVLKVCWHDDFMDAWSKDHHKRIFAAFDLVYLSMWHRLSGSAATSALNTTGSAFTEYVSKRLKYAPGARSRGAPNQRQYDPSEAYASLGMYGGDDGALYVPDGFDIGRYEYAAQLVGQKIEISQVVGPLCFLGRYFGELRSGSTNSCADIRRQLVKFHLTTDSLTDSRQKFIEKAYAYHVLDAETPLLGELGSKAVRMLGKAVYVLPDHMDGTMSWNARLVLLNDEKPFTNYQANWMWELVNRTLDGFAYLPFCNWCLGDSLCIPVPFLMLDDPTVKIDDTAHVPMVTRDKVEKLLERVKKMKVKPLPSNSVGRGNRRRGKGEGESKRGRKPRKPG